MLFLIYPYVVHFHTAFHEGWIYITTKVSTHRNIHNEEEVENDLIEELSSKIEGIYLELM